MVDDKFSIIHQVVSANDIVDVVSEYVNLKQRGRNYMGLCPFHREKTPSFSVSPDKQIFKCFGCGAGGDVIKFVQRILNVGFWEAVEVLANRVGIRIPEKKKRGQVSVGSPSRTEIFSANKWAAEYYHKVLFQSEYGKDAVEYLARRNLSEEICKKFLVGFAPGDKSITMNGPGAGFSRRVLESAGLIRSKEGGYFDMFRRRITFPIFDVMGNVVGFGARTISGEEPKYINTAETAAFSKQRQMFGLYQAREMIKELKQVVVVEGYTDVLASHQVGICNVVATLGTALTDQHVNILRRYADEIILIFDADEAGQKAANRAIEIFLTMGVNVKIATIPEGKDPHDYINERGKDAFRRLVDSAVDALDYKWNKIKEIYKEADSITQKRSAIEEFLTLIAQTDIGGRVDVIQRGMFISRLAELLNLPAEELYFQLKRFRRRVGPHGREERKSLSEIPLPESPVQSAYRDILEVLLCEPGYISMIRNEISPEEFAPESFRKIAKSLWMMCERLGDEFTLAELIGTIEEPEIADLITLLYREGERRGNFYKTLEDAISLLREQKRDKEIMNITQALKNSASSEEVDKYLQTLHSHLKRRTIKFPTEFIE